MTNWVFCWLIENCVLFIISHDWYWSDQCPDSPVRPTHYWPSSLRLWRVETLSALTELDPRESISAIPVHKPVLTSGVGPLGCIPGPCRTPDSRPGRVLQSFPPHFLDWSIHRLKLLQLQSYSLNKSSPTQQYFIINWTGVGKNISPSDWGERQLAPEYFLRESPRGCLSSLSSPLLSGEPSWFSVSSSLLILTTGWSTCFWSMMTCPYWDPLRT